MQHLLLQYLLRHNITYLATPLTTTSLVPTSQNNPFHVVLCTCIHCAATQTCVSIRGTVCKTMLLIVFQHVTAAHPATCLCTKRHCSAAVTNFQQRSFWRVENRVKTQQEKNTDFARISTLRFQNSTLAIHAIIFTSPRL